MMKTMYSILGDHTILIEASVKLINLGRTSPFSPAASSSAASHSDKTVPTSCEKHSVQVLSGFGLPSARNVLAGVRDRHDGLSAKRENAWR